MRRGRGRRAPPGRRPATGAVNTSTPCRSTNVCSSIRPQGRRCRFRGGGPGATLGRRRGGTHAAALGARQQLPAMETPAVYGHVSSLAIFEPGERSLQFDEVRELIVGAAAPRRPVPPPARGRAARRSTTRTGSRTPTSTSTTTCATSRSRRRATSGSSRSSRPSSAAKHLDRRRPLWEMYVIDGLAGGAVAELTKIHHACIDGVSGAEILGVLLDITPEPPPVAPPGDALAARGRAVAVVDAGSGPRRARVTTPRRLPPRAPHRAPSSARSPGNFSLARAVGAPAPRAPRRPRARRRRRTPFNGMITPHRRFAFGSLPLADVKSVKQQLGGTVNDVVMAMCAGALRRWLHRARRAARRRRCSRWCRSRCGPRSSGARSATGCRR